MFIRNNTSLRKSILFLMSSVFIILFLFDHTVKLEISRRNFARVEQLETIQKTPSPPKPRVTAVGQSDSNTVTEPTVVQQSKHGEIFDCDSIESMLLDAKRSGSGVFRKQNEYGNRGVFFTKHFDDLHQMYIQLVIKEAAISNRSNTMEIYRYNSALKELANLRKLREMDFKGSPRVWGSCIKPQRVTYVVSRIIDSDPLCEGNGTDVRCALAQDVVQKISSSKNPGESALTFLEKAVCFFAQFERNHIFMEDFSGANFYYSPSTLDIFIVDADSLIFYGDTPILSRVSCHDDIDCPHPSGNLWPSHALNRKIYYGCGEMYGFCLNNTCQGIDSRLHTCGVGRWLVTSIRSLIPVSVYKDYRSLKNCMSESKPLLRCSLEQACSDTRAIRSKYGRTKSIR